MDSRQADFHGGNIYKAAKEYGINQNKILDFSANINPLGVPESVKRSIISNLEGLVNYPDPECTALKTGISDYLGIDQAGIIVGNGASEIISLVFKVKGLRKVLIPAPTFSEYSKAAKSLSIQVEYFELREKNEFRLDIEAFIKTAATDVDAIIICNPNNPTSKLVSKDELELLLEFAKKSNIFVIIDEAFIELTDKGNLNSMVTKVKAYDNLFVIRAFTKLFAIPGLRLGYGIGSSELIEKMWIEKLPWSVNSFACGLGTIFTKEKLYLEKTELWLKEEKERFYDELSTFRELKVFKPETNFILVRLLKETVTSSKLKEMLIERGFLIRDASNFLFLNDKFVRFAVKDRESNIKFINVLREYVK